MQTSKYLSNISHLHVNIVSFLAKKKKIKIKKIKIQTNPKTKKNF